MLSAGGPESPSPPPAELRVAICNIAHGRGATAGNWGGGGRAARTVRLREIAALLAERKPDVVVLNEVDFDSTWSGRVNQAAVIAREMNMPNRAEQRNVDVSLPFLRLAFGNAVLSRFPIRKARVVELPAYSTLEMLAAGRKKGLLCRLELPGGRELRLLAVHLEHRDEEVRVAAARVIERLRTAEKTPLLAAGDFNSSPRRYPQADLTADGRTALSLLLEGKGFGAAVKENPGPADFTFPSMAPVKAIDWVLAPAGWRLLEHTPLDSRLSDHRPVFVRVALPADR
jgi:endonuclease/exonuclease/phosphatase family metal-dependent hydrolase